MKSLWKKTAAVIIAAGMVAACSMPALAQAQEKTPETSGVATAYAVEAPLSGPCGDGLTFAFDPETGVLTITGEGDMWDFDGDLPWAQLTGSIQKIHIKQMVSNLVAWVTEHEHNLFRSLGDAPQADCKPISAQDREYNADGFSAQFGTHIAGQLVSCSVVSLGACQNGFRHGQHILAADFKIPLLHTFQQGIYNDLFQVVAFLDNRCAKTS